MASPTKHGPDPSLSSLSSSSFTSTCTETNNYNRNQSHNHCIRHRDNKEPKQTLDMESNTNTPITTTETANQPSRSLFRSIAKLLRMDQGNDRRDENTDHQGSRHVSEQPSGANHPEVEAQEETSHHHRPSQSTSGEANSLETKYRMLPLMIGCIVPVSILANQPISFHFSTSFPYLSPCVQVNLIYLHHKGLVGTVVVRSIPPHPWHYFLFLTKEPGHISFLMSILIRSHALTPSILLRFIIRSLCSFTIRSPF